ncbi:LysR family transcriptional regulator [Novosphingobium album (ex Hu et al. 2023)]|uniref:LysR family transcriptional regulator n=1 Tax=Novosphingobium album (ex Hu et al. 2023) TaxID=2930093 RepID=A0ABT0B7E2_9SPHN|nr:LysR family transcriptional regulator [Novosphingobium album (ex Hu et al. 2023)]MCJ2180734.1 LysR family transcriptional regulator [Novosphingobium album (ex Hu et al. 2023)]
MIDPRGLRVFLAVCRANSITGGARLLNISQPSVSNAIAQLERAAGAVLFERSRNGITLTPAGEALQVRAEAMENLLIDAEAQMRLAGARISGPLRIGGTPGALVSLLPASVAKLEDRIGQFDLRVVERPDADLGEMLRRGEIELAFVTTGLEAPPDDMEELTASQDPFALIVGPANHDLPGEVSLRDVAGMPWVLPEARGAFRRQVDALFMAAEVAVPQGAIRCDSLLSTKAIVRGSRRITVLPVQVASAELSIGVLRAVEIREARFQRSIGIRKLKSARLSVVAKALLEVIFA